MYQRALYLAEKGIQTIPLDHNKKSIVTFRDIQITPSFRIGRIGWVVTWN